MTVAPDRSLKTAGPKSGFHAGSFDLLEKTFVFAGANDRKIRSRRILRRFFVEINRNFQLLADAFAQLIARTRSLLPN